MEPPYFMSVLGLLIFSFLYFLFDKTFIKFFNLDSELAIEYDNASAALDKISTWTTWLAGIQTAAMAAMALLVKGDETIKLSPQLKCYSFYTLLFFGASIILAAWLLSALPSVQQRLSKSNSPSRQNDIYMMCISTFVPLRLGRFSGLFHFYFIVGIVFFALFIFELMINPTKYYPVHS